MGTWTDGLPGPMGTGTPGTWAQLGGSVPVDNGATHASKDFWDPVRQRRILWVWGTIPNGIQTIPREVTYDPRIGKVVYAPAREMRALRSASPTGALGRTPLAAGTPVALTARGTAVDIEVVFERPAAATTLTLVLAGSGGNGPDLTSYMAHTDLPGGDFNARDDVRRALFPRAPKSLRPGFS